MFGSSFRFLIILLIGLSISHPVFCEEFNYAQTQRKISLQEEFGDYMQSVREKISNTWTPPNVVENGHATVIFKLDKNGNVISSYIRETSGNSLYDESALNSIQKASPYKEFPTGVSRDSITVVYSFDSSIVSADYVKDLVAQSEIYINRNNQMALDILNKAIKEIEGDPAAYFLYARKHKIDKLMGNEEAAKYDLAECKRLKDLYNKQRIQKCKDALLNDETPFAYFALANAYELAGDYQKAIFNIDKAISMTDLNHAYKRYRAEIVMKNNK